MNIRSYHTKLKITHAVIVIDHDLRYLKSCHRHNRMSIKSMVIVQRLQL